MEGGNAYWSALPIDRCNLNKYGLIYQGKSTMVSDNSIHGLSTVYPLESKEITFALTLKSIEKVCGSELIRTEHPKLIILETKNGSPFSGKFNVVQNLDLFLYINSKFVYIERHHKTQMTKLYLNLIMQKCNLERND